MPQLATITSQGQLTIPKSMRQAFGIKGRTKTVIERRGTSLLVTPRSDFKSLSGSLSSSVRLTNKQLKEARDSFSRNWPRV